MRGEDEEGSDEESELGARCISGQHQWDCVVLMPLLMSPTSTSCNLIRAEVNR
jgi:hypothetical protein